MTEDTGVTDWAGRFASGTVNTRAGRVMRLTVAQRRLPIEMTNAVPFATASADAAWSARVLTGEPCELPFFARNLRRAERGVRCSYVMKKRIHPIRRRASKCKALVLRKRLRAEWAKAFKQMAARGDDKLLDGDLPSLSSWDEQEWEW